MDYEAYSEAVENGYQRNSKLPGPDFNMQVTNKDPVFQLFTHDEYETTVETVAKALVGLEALRDTLWRVDYALQASEQNIMSNNMAIRHQQEAIYIQRDVINASTIPNSISRTVHLQDRAYQV